MHGGRRGRARLRRPGYASLSRSLGGAGAGALGLLGLGLLLLPNAAAAVLGLAAGPGFVVGAGTLVSVHGVTLGAVPALPLLAALPDTQAVPLIAFVSQAIPALAGLVAGQHGRPVVHRRDGGSVVAGLPGSLAGVLLGAVSGVLVWVGGRVARRRRAGRGRCPAAGDRHRGRGPERDRRRLAAAVARWRAPADPDPPAGRRAPRLGSGRARSRPTTRARVVVLLSGTGSLCAALLDATEDPGYPADVVAVGADRPPGPRARPPPGPADLRLRGRRPPRPRRPGTARWPPRSPRTSPTWSSRPAS